MKQTEGMTSSSESWQDKLDELTPEQRAAIEWILDARNRERLMFAVDHAAEAVVHMVNLVAESLAYACREIGKAASSNAIPDNKEGEQQDEDS